MSRNRYARSRSSNKHRVSVKFWDLAPPDEVLRIMEQYEASYRKRAPRAKPITLPRLKFMEERP